MIDGLGRDPFTARIYIQKNGKVYWLEEGTINWGKNHIFDYIRQTDVTSRAQQIINANIKNSAGQIVSNNDMVESLIFDIVENGTQTVQGTFTKSYINQNGVSKNLLVQTKTNSDPIGAIVTITFQ